MLKRFEDFKKENLTTTDTILYRTYPINYFKFWTWREYVYNNRWKYPYLEIR